ncbi:Receptor-type tyrosine-protein phosphatase zeta [Taenia solium]|eukprot:TsM_001003600 transcript=TsM_001003600 gene=TsM_001003600
MHGKGTVMRFRHSIGRNGFCRPRAFIAAQGPKDTTFDDFWQMVWDENSNIIVMISNFVERGRTFMQKQTRAISDFTVVKGERRHDTRAQRAFSTQIRGRSY